MKFSLIHPTRSRVNKSMEARNKWVQSSGGEHFEWIPSIDEDDPERIGYLAIYGKCCVNKNRSAIDAINNAAKEAKGDILMVVSDDTEPIKAWDFYLLKWLDRRIDFIAKTQDGMQPWIITNPIMDRTYYNRFGYIYHPDYKHMFCDTELTCVADLTGRKITSNILFKHNHYSVTKEPPDAISKRADGTWDQGEKLFLERYKRNFDLPPDQIKGVIQDMSMIRWLERKTLLKNLQ